ncbi:hypothetical protein Efla_005476 [Eimeria flavescens]
MADLAEDSKLKELFKRGPNDMCFVYTPAELPPPPEDSSLPPQLTSQEPNSFARDSLLRRIPEEIIGRVLTENEVYLQLHPRSKELLLQLQSEMRNADTTKLRPLECFGGPTCGPPPPAIPCSCGFCRSCEEADVQMWNSLLLKEAIEEGATLSRLPWILSEVYCYRRMLHAFNFYTTLYDPFLRQKLAGLEAGAAAAGLYAQQLAALLLLLQQQQQNTENSLLLLLKPHIRAAVFASLEGNAGDLSLWPKGLSPAARAAAAAAAVGGQTQRPTWEEDPPWLLAADFEAFFQDFCSSSSSSGSSSRVVHLWTDNAGEELLSDLLLASILLASSTAQRVRLCVKQQPTYVSDATKDPVLGSWVCLLRQWEGEGRLLVSAAFFCVSPLELRRLPADFRSAWQREAALVILKGDMNYRRLLGV